MAQLVDTSLEGRLRDLEAAVRSLRATNLTDLATVVDASGATVPLSALAFGQVAARDAGQLTLTANAASWIAGTPALDVFVTGGRLRVDVAARLLVGGSNLRMAMSYSVTGPTDIPSTTGAPVQAADETRALAIKSTGNAVSVEIAGGFPDLVENLPRGWYRVTSAYQLYGEVNDPADTFGYAFGRRLFAAPL